MLQTGKGGPVDMTEARVQYKKAADQGDSFAQHNLALMLQKEETARIAFEQLMEEEKKETEKKKKKKSNQKNQKNKKQKDPRSAGMCSLNDAVGVTGRGVPVVNSNN